MPAGDVLLPVVTLWTTLLRVAAAAAELPHIVIVLADDLGWNDVSFHGSNQILTPNIDALAYNGIILNSHYVPALCTPSRASLLTGKYPTSMGMQHLVILAPEPWGLPLGETLMPRHFKRHGYATHAIGKWHLGFHEKEYTPVYRGFDSHFGYWNGFHDYYDHTMQSESLKGYDMRRGLAVDFASEGVYSTDAFTDEAVNIIEKHNSTEGPLFLYLAHLAPHAGNPDRPLQAPEEEVAKHSHISDPERRTYAAMVTRVDESLGRVVTALRNRNMLHNCIILFMSDNGAVTFGMHSNRGSNHPLRGLKESPWEGGVRGVAALWSPLLNRTQRVSDQLMHVADWLPTLYSAAGLDMSELGDVDGLDMWHALSHDGQSPRREVFNNYDELEGYSSLRVDSWKYVAGTAQGGEVDLWYGDTGQDGPLQYDVSNVLRSPTNEAIRSFEAQKKEGETRGSISQETVLKLRRDSAIVCDYPTFSSFFLITDNHNETVHHDSESVDLFGIAHSSESKAKILQELESFLTDSLGDVSPPPLNRADVQYLIDSGRLGDAFKCNPLQMALETRLEELKKSVVKPLNQPEDPFSDPALHNGVWANWCDVRREKNSRMLMESVASVLSLDHFFPVLPDNNLFHIFPSHLLQLGQRFFWSATLLVCAATALYAVASLRRVLEPPSDLARKKSWTGWENITFRSITNPGDQSQGTRSR